MTSRRAPLTPRQYDVVQELYRTGGTYREVANALGITVATVRAHMHAIADQLPGADGPRSRVFRHLVHLIQQGTP